MGGGKRRARPASPPDDERARPPKKVKRLRACDQDLLDASPADYYIVGDLRYAKPYRHAFRMTCKARWRGLRLVDVFNAELSKEREPGFWAAEFRGGRVLVNRRLALLTDVWHENDLVTHVVHRHESPVLHREIVTVHEDDDYLVVDKPPSIPVHPCGTYRRNSLTYLLASAGARHLRLVHRLDKQTSGIVVFAKSRESANLITEALAARELRKRYLARVSGRFPPGVSALCGEPLAVDEREMCTRVDTRNGREAQTLFRALAYDDQTGHSLLACEPQTGRSHQIRVHLRHLRFPIVNDPLYNEERRAEIEGKAGKEGGVEDGGGGDYLEDLPRRLQLDDGIEGKGVDDDGAVRREGVALGCETCPFVANSKGVDRDDDMTIFLHALEYEGEDWKYVTPLPDWARAFAGLDIGAILRDTPPLKDMDPEPLAPRPPWPSRSPLRRPSPQVTAPWSAGSVCAVM
jgi:RluA family pseudouridine synthase